MENVSIPESRMQDFEMDEICEISAFAEMTKALRATQILIDRCRFLQPQQWAGD